MQIKSFHVLQLILDGMTLGGQVITMVLDLDSCGVGLPVSSPNPHHQGGLSSIAPANSPHEARVICGASFPAFMSAGSPLLSHIYTIRASSIVLPR